MIKKAKRTYFLMTNQKGDYGCFFFEDYELYKRTWLQYKELGYIDETNYIQRLSELITDSVCDL